MSSSPYLDLMIGFTVPGGCDDCRARQTLSKDDYGVYHLLIEHDATCPRLARFTAPR